MKRVVTFCAMMFVLSLCLWGFSSAVASAQEDDTAGTETNWKDTLSGDKQAVHEQQQQIKGNAQAARAEERALLAQIREAEQAGNPEQVQALRNQLKSMHQENVQQMKQDLMDLKSARTELRTDRKEARMERMDANDNGTLEPIERKRMDRRMDWDNNPPGMAGGPGTNWENRPGPQGGPGAGPDRRGFDRDNNPPGPKGGKGTNWENRPGPQGGPGASPNKKKGFFQKKAGGGKKKQ